MIALKMIFLTGASLALTFAAVGHAPAAIVTESFLLDRSNTLPDNVDYGVVTLTADATAGRVTFEVTAPYVYGGSPSSNYGYDKFFFNTNDLLLATDFTIVGPEGWDLDFGSHQASEFGKYDLLLKPEPGQPPIPKLQFAIQLSPGKEAWATIENFANLDGPSSSSPSLHFFAGHVRGFAESLGATSHYATGSTPVPEPSAIALWGLSGILGLILARRLRR